MHHDTGFCNLAVRRALRNAYGYLMIWYIKESYLNSIEVVFNVFTFFVCMSYSNNLKIEIECRIDIQIR